MLLEAAPLVLTLWYMASRAIFTRGMQMSPGAVPFWVAFWSMALPPLIPVLLVLLIILWLPLFLWMTAYNAFEGWR